MKKILLSFCLFALFINSHAQEPQNLFITKQKLIEYCNCGDYQKDQTKTILAALNYLKTRLKEPNKKPLAIVLDIDETTLSNYDDMLTLDFGGTFKQIVDAEGKGKDKVIPATLELYNFAKSNHVAVFFITGRTEFFRGATEENLKQVGFKNWDGLILKPENYTLKTAAIFKTKARQEIEKKGFDIVLNIGDQQSDLVGGHADKTFKMPNPYYFVP